MKMLRREWIVISQSERGIRENNHRRRYKRYFEISDVVTSYTEPIVAVLVFFILVAVENVGGIKPVACQICEWKLRGKKSGCDPTEVLSEPLENQGLKLFPRSYNCRRWFDFLLLLFSLNFSPTTSHKPPSIFRWWTHSRIFTSV